MNIESEADDLGTRTAERCPSGKPDLIRHGRPKMVADIYRPVYSYMNIRQKVSLDDADDVSLLSDADHLAIPLGTPGSVLQRESVLEPWICRAVADSASRRPTSPLRSHSGLSSIKGDAWCDILQQGIRVL